MLWTLRHYMAGKSYYYFTRRGIIARVCMLSITYTYSFAPSLMSGGFVVFPLPASLALPIAIAENRQGAETIIPILSLLRLMLVGGGNAPIWGNGIAVRGTLWLSR